MVSTGHEDNAVVGDDAIVSTAEDDDGDDAVVSTDDD